MRGTTFIAALFLARGAFPQTPGDARARMDEALRSGVISCRAADKADHLEISCPINSVSLADLIKALPINAGKDRPVEVIFPLGDPWKLSMPDIKNIREINELLDEGITKGQSGHVRFYVNDKNDRTPYSIGKTPGLVPETLVLMDTAYLKREGAIASAISVKKGLLSQQREK